ncbi:hypothetical protein TNCV_3208781 [Trichonephila clavipes]|nr:hypothetical protein TNCV_3208781 [Trichonephila clavipes]
MPPDRQRPDRGPRNLSWQRAKCHLSLDVALNTIQVTVRFGSILLQFRGRTLWGWSEDSRLSSPSTNLTRGLDGNFEYPLSRRHYTFTNIHVFSGIRAQAL